jgi:PhnB protein
VALDAANSGSFQCTIAPWQSVRKSAQAVEFYEAAFGAREVFRLEDASGGVLARLSVEGAEFWVGDESPAYLNFSPESLGGGTVRMVLTVADPDAVFLKAVSAGAKEVVPVGEFHGWRVGRVVDTYGHHWEIGREVDD